MEINIRKSTCWSGFYEGFTEILRSALWKNERSAKLKLEELHTVLVQVENIIDTRPFTYLSNENCDDCMTPSHLMYGRSMNRWRIVENNDTIVTSAWNAILAKSWDLFSWRTVKILLRTVKIFMINGRYFIINGRDFHHDSSRISSLWVQIFIAYCFAKIPGREGSISPSSFYWQLPDY